MKNCVFSFDEACARLGISNVLPDVSLFPEGLQKHVTATYKLSRILEVNNGDWKPDMGDTDQWKYYPWFKINEGSSGFALSYFGFGYDYSFADLGARLACRSSELAVAMGKNCIDLYTELLS